MADERSRSPRRDIVWVKVKDGNPVMIKLSQMEAPQNVFNLLEAVKQVSMFFMVRACVRLPWRHVFYFGEG